MAYSHAQCNAYTAGGEQYYLRGTAKRIAPIDIQCAREKAYERYEGYGAEPGRWLYGGGVVWLLVGHVQCIIQVGTRHAASACLWVFVRFQGAV